MPKHAGNHNPRVGGSSPSSGIKKSPANRTFLSVSRGSAGRSDFSTDFSGGPLRGRGVGNGVRGDGMSSCCGLLLRRPKPRQLEQIDRSASGLASPDVAVGCDVVCAPGQRDRELTGGPGIEPNCGLDGRNRPGR